MPRFDDICPANDRAVEDAHAMAAPLRTRGEARTLAGLVPEPTPPLPGDRRIIAPV